MVGSLKRDYETDAPPRQHRSEDLGYIRDADLDNAFGRWKSIAVRSMWLAGISTAGMLGALGAAGFFGYLWMTEAPRPVAFRVDPQGVFVAGESVWPGEAPSDDDIRSGLRNLFWRARRIGLDESYTAEAQEAVPAFLSARANNQLADYNRRHPLRQFYENRQTRLAFGFDDRMSVQRDPNASHIYYVKWKEKIVDQYGRTVPRKGPRDLVEKEAVEVSATVFVILNPSCPRDIPQLTANPNCVVVDEFQWDAID